MIDRKESRSMSQDDRVDAYIERQADFARPILRHLRAAVQAACPEAEEAIKWGMPHFMYKGQMLAGMAAFREHATFGFRHGSLVTGGDGGEREPAMGQFGRLSSIEDLPDGGELAGMIRKAMALTDEGVKPQRKKTEKPAAETPEDLGQALSASPAAAATFEGFSPSCRREYIDWVTEAKRPETRSKRIEQAIEWMADGKKRNWKYENC
jgi:uncharacterized protein YdeI (YjbR/CyaY-like superfamily)